MPIVHRCLARLFAGLILLGTLPLLGGSPPSFLPFSQAYCQKCHGAPEGKTKGGVDLVGALAGGGLIADVDLLEKLVTVLRDGDMPPEGESQPLAEERARWVTELEAMLDDALSTLPVTRVPIRRMNRVEYNLVIKDLFQLNRDPFALPERIVQAKTSYFDPASGRMPDVVEVGNRAMGKSQFVEQWSTLPGVSSFPRDHRAEHGFDNRAEDARLSPDLMEAFLGLGTSILNSPKFEEYSGHWDKWFVFEGTLEELKTEGALRLKAFLKLAFRDHVPESVVNLYRVRLNRALDEGRPFAESMKASMAAALVSPRFLFHQSRLDPRNPDRLDPYALASRLSFFLWSSGPDRELLDKAGDGSLSEASVLRQEAARLMNDPRVKGFCDRFALQWLQLEHLIGALPDIERYREYYFLGSNQQLYRAGMHMMIEPLLLFETVLVEDRSIMDLIDPAFTYQSDFLKHWDDVDAIPERGWWEPPNVWIPFKRVPVNNRRWGGVVFNRAVMTMTSGPRRTKPISRGAWLLTTLFNDPPPPPPPGVGEVDVSEERLEEEGLTVRQKLRAHQAREECASCHRKIDPLGFALENYDPVGRWRSIFSPLPSAVRWMGGIVGRSIRLSNDLRHKVFDFVR